MLINQAGTYKCRIVDHGLAKSSGGWPQWVAQFEAVEAYDKEEDTWLDWAGEEENEIKGYFVLIGKSGETLGVKQIMAATGWDGVSFIELAAMDLSEVIVQTRIEPNTYKEKTTLQISWMDHEDAVPGGSVQKLDADGIKKLQAEFGHLLGNAGTVKAAGAPPKGKPKTPPVAPPKAGTVTKTSKAARIAAAKKAAGVEPEPEPETTGVPEDKVEADTPTPITPPPDVAPGTTGSCTKAEAWEECASLRTEKFDDAALAVVWQEAVTTNGVKPKDLTDEDYFKIKELVLAKVAKF